MQKLRLELDNLVVETFATEPDAGARAGTILANSGTEATHCGSCGDTCYIGSCYPMTCAGQDFCQHSYHIEECTSAGGGVTQCPTGSAGDPGCVPWTFQVGCTE